MLKFATALSLWAVAIVYANNAIPENYFSDAQGLLAAQAGAPQVSLINHILDLQA
jgi:hypothetical protein